MAAESLLTRFDGNAGRTRLKTTLEEQVILCGNSLACDEVVQRCHVRELAINEILIRQDAADNDIYFVLAGAFAVIVNGRRVAVRRAGQHLGEMAIIDPAARRSATVIASEPSVVARMNETDFLALADKFPTVWRLVSRELSRRLDERRKFHAEPNEKPILFIGSSSEQLPVAETFARLFPPELAAVTVWNKGVFGASRFPIEDLEAQVKAADFALLVAGDDDEVTSRGTVSSTPRDNVVFELGLFMGALSRQRTFILSPKGTPIKLPTDLLGITHLRFDPGACDPGAGVESAVAELAEIVRRDGPR
jgi:CRP/FNR family transcriptional regulator, cyclic AMP receptor protein